MPRLTLSPLIDPDNPPPTEPTAGVYADNGYIDFDNFIDAVDITREYNEANEPVPSPIKQWMARKDFYRALFKVSLECDPTYKGATEFRLNVEVVGDGDSVPPQIDDVGPSTKWIQRNVTAEGTIKIGTGFLGGLLKLVPIGNTPLADLPIPEGNISFNYNWNPKVAEVIASGAGQGAQWVLRATNGTYLDGSHQFVLLIRTPKQMQDLRLKVYSAWARYRRANFPIFQDTFEERQILEIPIRF